MKKVTIILFLLSIHIAYSQEDQTAVKKWFQSVINDMKAMNDLSKYSHKKLNSEVAFNFLMIEKVKDVKVTNDKISVLVDHGTDVFCTQLVFQFTKVKDTFYLIFQKPTRDTTKKKLLVNPWFRRIKLCEE